MTDTLERAARAVELTTIRLQGEGKHVITGYNDSVAFARAVIEALIEPDIQTHDAGTHALYPYDQSYGWAPKAALEVWQAMLRSILREKV